MEKCTVLHNMLCYKYVYFYCTWCNQNGKKNTEILIVDIICLRVGGGGLENGEYGTRREKKSVTN